MHLISGVDWMNWMGLGWESPDDKRYRAPSGAKHSLHNNGDGDDQVAVNGIDYWENFLVYCSTSVCAAPTAIHLSH